MQTERTQHRRAELLRAGTLHWVHWLVIGGSLVVTLGAWRFSSNQLEEKAQAQFTREADQVVELVVERMARYEDALWAGVGAIQAQGGRIAGSDWRAFAESLSLERKYPGINGIGVIESVLPEELDAHLSARRLERADYHVHPEHDQRELFPITYIEPVALNLSAVGLDVAHEANRRQAAQRARDTGSPQVTGPIILVQDAERTPGFLFYAPFYRGPANTEEERRANFLGMVYAPFVVKNLMAGTLARDVRHVGLRIHDGDDTLYNEHVESDADYDQDPLYARSTDVDLYGRTWRFDIRSGHSFRAIAQSSQPLTILIGGLVVDALLLALFLLISRANRRAIAYADAATADLELRTDELLTQSEHLQRSNTDLEQFAYVAAHDLQEPLRMVVSFAQLLESEFRADLPDDAMPYLDYVTSGARRMQALIDSLLSYSRVGTTEFKPQSTDANEAVVSALANLSVAINESGAEIESDELPHLSADPVQLIQVFQNLIGNAVKFRGDATPKVQIRVAKLDDASCTLTVEDNGIGIRPEYQDRIFTIFKRLHHRDEYEGTGIGLSVTKKIVERHGGEIWVSSVYGEGTTFHVTLPRAAGVATRASGASDRVSAAHERGKPPTVSHDTA